MIAVDDAQTIADGGDSHMTVVDGAPNAEELGFLLDFADVDLNVELEKCIIIDGNAVLQSMKKMSA